MTQGFFHEEEYGFFVRRAGVQDAIRMEAGTGEARGKDVVVEGTPEDRTVDAGQDACGEQSGGGWAGVASARDFVQGGTGEAVFGQMDVDLQHAEGKRSVGGRVKAFQSADAGAERLYGCMGWAHVRILFSYSGSVKLWGVCSRGHGQAH